MVDFANQTLRKFTPQQRARQAAINAQNALFEKLNREELKRRDHPIKAIANAYNVTTGEWDATTPDGGTVAARSLSNANIKGKSLPVQRFQGSAQSAINERPTDANFGEVYSALEETANNLTNLMGIQYGTGDPNNETVAGILDVTPRNSQDSFYDTNTGLLWRWDTDVDGDPPDPSWKIVFSAGLSSSSVNPNDVTNGFDGLHDGDTHYQNDVGTLWRWDADLESDPPSPVWVPVWQLYQDFTGTPAATVYIDGAIAINDSNTIYTGTVADGWTEFSGGGGGFDGVILYNSALDQGISYSKDAFGISFAGWSEEVDTGAYFDAATNASRFFLPSAGLYRVSFQATVETANELDAITYWRVEAELKNGATLEDWVAADASLTIASTDGSNFLDKPNRTNELNLNLSRIVKCLGTGRHIQIAVAQYSAFEDGGSISDAGALSLGNEYSASFSVEKLN